jgi:hypothetical protein
MDEWLRYLCEIAGIDWVPDGAGVTEPYRDPDRPHRWVAFIAGGNEEQPGLASDRRDELVVRETRGRPQDPPDQQDADCWLVPVYLTRDEAQTLRLLE